MAADYDHAITCPTQAERRAEVERLRAAGYGKARVWTIPDWQRVDNAARGPEMVEDDPYAVCPCGNHDGPMYRGRPITELEDEIEAGREAMNRRLMG